METPLWPLDAETLRTVWDEIRTASLRPDGTMEKWSLSPPDPDFDAKWKATVEVAKFGNGQFVVASGGKACGRPFRDYGTAMMHALGLTALEYEKARRA